MELQITGNVSTYVTMLSEPLRKRADLLTEIYLFLQLSSVSDADAYLQHEIANMERRFEENIHRTITPPESLEFPHEPETHRETMTQIRPATPESEPSSPISRYSAGTVEELEEKVTAREIPSAEQTLEERITETVIHHTPEPISPADMVEGLEVPLAHQLLTIQQEQLAHTAHGTLDEQTLLEIHQHQHRKLSAPYIAPGHLSELMEEENTPEAVGSEPLHQLVVGAPSSRKASFADDGSAEVLEEPTEVLTQIHEEQATVHEASPPSEATMVQSPEGLVVEVAERRLSSTTFHDDFQVGSDETMTPIETVAESIVERAFRSSLTEASAEDAVEVLEEHAEVREVFTPMAELLENTAEIESFADEVAERAIRSSLTEMSHDEMEEILQEPHVETSEVFAAEPERIASFELEEAAEHIVDTAIRSSLTETLDDDKANEILEEHVEKRKVSPVDFEMCQSSRIETSEEYLEEHVEAHKISPPEPVDEQNVPVVSRSAETVTHIGSPLSDTEITEVLEKQETRTRKVSSPEPEYRFHETARLEHLGSTDEHSDYDENGHEHESGEEHVEVQDVSALPQLALDKHAITTEPAPDETPEFVKDTAHDLVEEAVRKASSSQGRRGVSFDLSSETHHGRKSPSSSASTPEAITRTAEEVVETAIRHAAFPGGDDATASNVEAGWESDEGSVDLSIVEAADELVDTAIAEAMRARAHSIDEQRRVTFDVIEPPLSGEPDEDAQVNRFASPEPEEHTTAERFRPKTPEEPVESPRSDSEMSEESDRLAVEQVVKRHVSFDTRAPVEIADEREDSVDLTEQTLIDAERAGERAGERGGETYVKEVSVSSEEEVASGTGTDETTLEKSEETEPSLDTEEGEMVRRTSYGSAASTIQMVRFCQDDAFTSLLVKISSCLDRIQSLITPNY